MITKLFSRRSRARAVAFLIAAVPVAVPAALLDPGHSIALRWECAPAGGHLLAAQISNLSTPAFRGTLFSSVWSNDAANPWDGLTFAYKLANASFCHDVTLGQFAVTGFEGCLTDVSFFGCGVAPRSACRSGDGSLVGFNFLNRKSEGTLDPGEVSAWLVIQTNCRSWEEVSGVTLDSVDVNVSSFGPTLVPEPATLPLVVMGAMLLARGRGRMRG
jgi:hypothetical protein